MFDFQIQIIWNSSTRSELLKFVEEQRTSQGPDGTYDLKDSHEFTYTSLSKELCVGNVYLRVYNDQPEFEISEPEAFCIALVEFIDSAVHDQSTTASLLQNNENLSASNEKSELANDMEDQSHDQQTSPSDSVAVSDEKVSKEDKSSLLKKLRSALISLKVYTLLCIGCKCELVVQLYLQVN